MLVASVTRGVPRTRCFSLSANGRSVRPGRACSGATSWALRVRNTVSPIDGGGCLRVCNTAGAGSVPSTARVGSMTSQQHRQKSGFETRAIHAGYEPDPTTGAVIPPIYATSTYKQDGVGGLRGGYEYSRSANPTRTALEGALAALEDGERGFAFASGLAAEATVLRAVCRPGDHAVIPDDAYGGTFRLFAKVEGPWGVDHTTAAVNDVDAVRAAIQPGKTRMVWLETPTNPLLNIGDIEALA